MMFGIASVSTAVHSSLKNDAREQERLQFSVVMPCLNEAETLRACITAAQNALSSAGISGEIIVADNGSTDDSARIALESGARVVDVQERGYGSALQGGIAAARGAWILMGDSDSSHDFSHIPLFLAELRSGADLVIGNRFRGGIASGAMPLLHRYLGTPVLTAIGRLFFRVPAGDINCGFRAFTREAYERMALRSTGMEFATEMIVKAAVLGMKVAEVPTTQSPAGRTRPAHLRTWRDGWRHLRFLLMYSPRWLFLYPGIFLMLAGGLVGAWLMRGPQTIGSVTFDVNMLLYAGAAVLLGFQAITFAVFTKIFAISEGLLPKDPKFDRIFQYVTLEVGLAVGGVIAAAGIIATVVSIYSWEHHHFAALDPSHAVRIVAPAVVALTLGIQIILSSFFLSILGLRRE